MTAPELTLNGIRESLSNKGRAFRVSDFLTAEEKQKRQKSKANRKPKKYKFSRTDAIMAEIIGRFGYEFYREWNKGEFDEELAYRMLDAERAREAANRIQIESVIVAMVKDCIRRTKKEKRPGGPKEAAKIIKRETKIAMGEK